MKLQLVKDDGKTPTLSPFDKKVIAFRKKVISVLQNRKLSIVQRLVILNEICGIDLNKKSIADWIKVFCSLEKLSINDFTFNNLSKTERFAEIENGFELEYEQLLCYLSFRHISRAIDMLDLKIRLAFVLLSFNVINHIFSLCENKNLDSLVEVCRFYSSEIETSDNNIFELLNQIESLVSFI